MKGNVFLSLICFFFFQFLSFLKDGLLEISAIASGAVDYVLGLKSIFGDVWVLNGNSLSSVNSLQWVPAVDISNSNFKSGFIDDSHAYVYSSEFRNTIEPIGKDKGKNE